MNRRSARIMCALFALAFCLSLFAGCDKNEPKQPGQTTADDSSAFVSENADPFLITEGVRVVEMFSYNGPYIEDGSNEPCENVCAVRIENTSETHYRYLRFSIVTADGAYTFSATTLFAGARMTVLCENRAAYSKSTVLSNEILSIALFDRTPTVHIDSLLITYTDGFINVKNLTDETLSGVYVYYKDTDDFGYLGGITYRTSFGDLEAGNTVQARASNIRAATGKVVFATYAD